jgi:hypothetical protein
MKTTLFNLLFAMLLLPNHTWCQSLEADWEKQFNLSESYTFSDVVENNDGSFTVLGAIDKKGESGFDLWLLNFNSNGDTVNTIVFSRDSSDVPVRLIQLPDGGYLLAALNGNPGSEQTPWVICISPDGSEKWRKSHDAPTLSGRTDVALNADATWWWLNNTDKEQTPAAVKLSLMNSDGEQIAETIYTDKMAMYGHALRVLPDGSLAISGQIEGVKGNATMWAMRVNSSGEKIWKTVIPGSGKTISPECICCTADNNLMVAGWIGSCMNPDAAPEDQIYDYDLVLTKIDGAGKLVWSKNFDREGSEGGNAVAVRPDGNILIAGICKTSFTGTVGPWLILADKSGKLLQEQVDKFRFSGDQASRIINTSDGGFVMVGPGKINPETRKCIGWIKKFKPLLQ